MELFCCWNKFVWIKNVNLSCPIVSSGIETLPKIEKALLTDRHVYDQQTTYRLQLMLMICLETAEMERSFLPVTFLFHKVKELKETNYCKYKKGAGRTNRNRPGAPSISAIRE